MKKLFFVFVLFLLLFASCSKDDNNTTFTNEIPSNGLKGFEFDDEIVDSIFGVFESGHNYYNGYTIDLYPDLFGTDPIETEIYLGKKNRKKAYITLPNGTVMLNCPKKGKTCGNVYWRSDSPSSIFKFIGYYE